MHLADFNCLRGSRCYLSPYPVGICHVIEGEIKYCEWVHAKMTAGVGGIGFSGTVCSTSLSSSLCDELCKG